MNRRKFAQSVMGGVGVSMLASGPIQAAKPKSKQQPFEAGHELMTTDGLKMTLSDHQLPTKNRDRHQFILTFDVHNNQGTLQEKIYDVTDHNGVKHQIFMTPAGEQQLQAVFNWRTRA